MVDMEEDIEEDMVEDTGDDLSDNLNSLTAFDLLFLYFKITWCWFAHFMLNIGMNIVHSSAHFCSTTHCKLLQLTFEFFWQALSVV